MLMPKIKKNTQTSMSTKELRKLQWGNWHFQTLKMFVAPLFYIRIGQSLIQDWA